MQYYECLWDKHLAQLEKHLTKKERTMTESKAKAKGTSRASKPRKSATKSKSPPKGGAKAKPGKSASRLTDQRTRDLGDWREETLARMRALILEADPEMIEERKWRKPSNAMAGVPVWSHHGIVCTGETYTKVVKLTFARGAKIPDPSRLFNSSLEGNTRRAIDIHEGEKVDAGAFKALVKAAVAQNAPPAKKAKPGANEAKPVKLLSGGNPQIAKADGDAPVQAYIAAMPGWKHDVGRRLDALIVRNVPNVRKAVKWNTPFYGVEDQEETAGSSASIASRSTSRWLSSAARRCDRSRRASPSKRKCATSTSIEDDQLDEAQFADWVKQASQLPGERM